ncbi:hypothetical protein SAMN04488550_0934 [Gordonia malaquae]|uniref:Uncharacterized protein n=2 Tax=Gordonia malaquae TaxID=410332 RepID=M3UP33_GORML|nr:hypothetical protein GM1_061_00050 [Gordonia malaquae NBRC 108250]SEB87112.1 hypothetical protein SAMN04488550_0934 [Gordonia malaquae]
MQAPHATDLEDLGLQVSHDVESPWVTTVTATNYVDESITVTWSTQEDFAWIQFSISETPRVEIYRDQVESLQFSRDPNGSLQIHISTRWPDTSGSTRITLDNRVIIRDSVTQSN